jgi:hypothetical protein
MTPTRDPGNRRNSASVTYLFQSPAMSWSLLSLLYHILMYIISIELVRFSALSPMILEGTTFQSRAA